MANNLPQYSYYAAYCSIMSTSLAVTQVMDPAPAQLMPLLYDVYVVNNTQNTIVGGWSLPALCSREQY